MTVMLPQLSLLVVTVVQLTSTQPTYDVTHQGNDVNSCGRTEQVLSQLVKAVSQLQKDVQVVIGNRETNATAKGTLRNHNSQNHKKSSLRSRLAADNAIHRVK